MRITKRAARRLATAALGLAAVAGVAATVSATAFARTTATAAVSGPACRAGQLSLRLAGTDTAVGSTALTVAIANRSARACVLTGYPALRLLRGNGTPVVSSFGHGSGGWFAGQPVSPVRLTQAEQASFFITYRDFSPSTGQVTPAVNGMRVRLPGVSGQFTVTARFAPYGPISVSPVRAGARKE